MPTDFAQLPTPAALRRRRFAAIPLRGPGAAFTEAQGREPGLATSPRELSDLISSIAEVGVIQPILLEELPAAAAAASQLRVVVGERRLRASRWGAVHLPDNPHFASIPASICPGPLTEEDRRIWQLIENLAREPLQPGEQAAALLYQRCAQLTANLVQAGYPVPDEVTMLDDPVERFRVLEEIRGADPGPAAPWTTVLARLGLQLTERRASELVRAFKVLPREVSQEMDEHRVRVATRIKFAALRADRQAAADEIWLALKASGRPELLYAATGTAAQDPDLPAEDAVEHAALAREAANQARAEAITKPGPDRDGDEPGPDHPGTGGPADPPNSAEGVLAENLPAVPVPADPPAVLAPEAVRGALSGLRALLAGLRRGHLPEAYDRGSLRLLLDEARTLIGE